VTNQGNGSRFFTLRWRRWVTTEEIAPPVHIEEMGQAALMMMQIDIRASSILVGFRFVFWESNKAKGDEGEIRSEENGGE